MAILNATLGLLSIVALGCASGVRPGAVEDSRAVALDGRFAEGYVLLAYLHLTQGAWELALTFLDQAEQLAADDHGYLAEVEILRGTVLERLGHSAEARDAYRRALRLVPDDVRARAGLAGTGDR